MQNSLKILLFVALLLTMVNAEADKPTRYDRWLAKAPDWAVCNHSFGRVLFGAKPKIARVEAISRGLMSEESLSRGLHIGMPYNDLLCVLGEPERVNETITREGSRRQLIYPRKYIYIVNGAVEAIQTM